ncbi:sulfurtransferase [Prauserella marina]|uniref:Rhodanese-related sulfurtransferase n=1 Tax=Prauserella marina TaxID=530584 RepID=A0A222VII3_9PSEU|nr:rhodanese-like domain-containing protein [Prauserella marina]ASR33725.1 sulfurtransferase [Prauserella marina]PWV82288.1 rhodanese-related sulfurtransferase [Prauserella marina]SDC65358.1 Rhodanese-related sulfurtransferase [Prauserella marina]
MAVVNPAEVPTVSVSELPSEDVVLLDVREPDEWAAGHAPEAVHIPLGDLPARVAELAELPDDKPVYVVCRSGGRSARAAAWLNAAGVVDAVNVAGGMKSWLTEGRSIVGDREGVRAEVL